jgi:hypothetical protein
MASLTLPKFLAKPAGEVTPWPLKVGVGFLICVSIQPLIEAFRDGQLSTLIWIARIVVLLGIWNLKRWAVVAYACLVTAWVVDVVLRGIHLTIFGVLIGALFHYVVIIYPSLAYWRRMTWT